MRRGTALDANGVAQGLELLGGFGRDGHPRFAQRGFKWNPNQHESVLRRVGAQGLREPLINQKTVQLTQTGAMPGWAIVHRYHSRP